MNTFHTFKTLKRQLYLCLTGFVISFALVSVAAERYTVKPGDSLSGIARKQDVPLGMLKSANPEINPLKLQIGQILIIPNPLAPVDYTVKSGDSIERIARKHNLSTKSILALNALKNPNKLKIGQTLKLPPEAAPSVSTYPNRHPKLTATVQQAIDNAPVRRRRWKYIVIHHSATDAGSMKGMDEYHRNKRRMTNGLAYHFVIGNGTGMRNGEVGVGNRWKRQLQGGHLASEPLNNIALGICLVGNFEKNTPTDAQLKSLEALLDSLLDRTGLKPDAIRTHRAINNKPTRCPGRRFPISFVRSKFD